MILFTLDGGRPAVSLLLPVFMLTEANQLLALYSAHGREKRIQTQMLSAALSRADKPSDKTPVKHTFTLRLKTSSSHLSQLGSF